MVSLASVGADALAAFKSDVDLGDHLFVHGEVITSRRGELSVLADSWAIAAKALRPLPVAHKPLSEESRVRQRYVDLIVRPQARRTVQVRSVVNRSLRATLSRAGLSRSRNANAAGAARRRGGATVRHAHECHGHGSLSCASRRSCI